MKLRSLRENIQDWANNIKKQYDLIQFQVYESNKDWRLANIVISKNYRNQGLGSNIMNRLCQFADQHNKRITLTPDDHTSPYGTTSRIRLINFYKRFGFVINHGKYRDYKLTDLMYRDPK